MPTTLVTDVMPSIFKLKAIWSALLDGVKNNAKMIIKIFFSKEFRMALYVQKVLYICTMSARL